MKTSSRDNPYSFSGRTGKEGVFREKEETSPWFPTTSNYRGTVHTQTSYPKGNQKAQTLTSGREGSLEKSHRIYASALLHSQRSIRMRHID